MVVFSKAAWRQMMKLNKTGVRLGLIIAGFAIVRACFAYSPLAGSIAAFISGSALIYLALDSSLAVEEQIIYQVISLVLALMVSLGSLNTNLGIKVYIGSVIILIYGMLTLRRHLIRSKTAIALDWSLLPALSIAVVTAVLAYKLTGLGFLGLNPFGQPGPRLIWLWIIPILIFVSAEELVFRCIIQTSAAQLYRHPILITALIYAAIFSLFAPAHMAELLVVFALALLSGWLFKKSGGLLSPIAMRATTAFLLYFVLPGIS